MSSFAFLNRDTEKSVDDCVRANKASSCFFPISGLILTVAGAPVGSELHQVGTSTGEGLVVVDEAEM